MFFIYPRISNFSKNTSNIFPFIIITILILVRTICAFSNQFNCHFCNFLRKESFRRDWLPVLHSAFNIDCVSPVITTPYFVIDRFGKAFIAYKTNQQNK